MDIVWVAALAALWGGLAALVAGLGRLAGAPGGRP